MSTHCTQRYRRPGNVTPQPSQVISTSSRSQNRATNIWMAWKFSNPNIIKQFSSFASLGSNSSPQDRFLETNIIIDYLKYFIWSMSWAGSPLIKAPVLCLQCAVEPLMRDQPLRTFIVNRSLLFFSCEWTPHNGAPILWPFLNFYSSFIKRGSIIPIFSYGDIWGPRGLFPRPYRPHTPTRLENTSDIY